MLSKKMEEALNKQLNAEAYSSYLYLAMSASLEAQNLPGSAHWMRVQSQEELGHVMKFYKYIVERRGRVTLRAIEAPPAEWDSPLAAFEEAFRHEQKVTGLINELVELAAKEKDPATGVFLQWFVSEQVEEEASVDKVVQVLRLAGKAPGGLLVIDHKLGERSASKGG